MMAASAAPGLVDKARSVAPQSNPATSQKDIQKDVDVQILADSEEEGDKKDTCKGAFQDGGASCFHYLTTVIYFHCELLDGCITW